MEEVLLSNRRGKGMEDIFGGPASRSSNSLNLGTGPGVIGGKHFYFISKSVKMDYFFSRNESNPAEQKFINSYTTFPNIWAKKKYL